MAPISFNQLPANLRRPGVYAEISNERAIQGVVLKPYRLLMIGQRRTAGTVAELVPTRITSAGQAAAYFGSGSMLHGMAEAHFQNNRFTELWACAIDDPAGGTAATGTLVFGATATAAGTIYLMVAGRRLTIGVASGATAATVATSVNAAINARTDLPVTSAVDTVTVTVTAKHAGTSGNEIDLRVNYYDGEALPAGLTLTVNAMATGAGVVDLDEVWAVLGDEHYDVIAQPYTDASNLTSLEQELEDRWSGTRMIEGVAFTATSADHSGAATLGSGRNSPHVSIVSSHGSPSPVWEWAAAAAALVGFYGGQDPARPFQTLELEWVVPPALAARFTDEERNLLLYDGISVTRVAEGGKVRVERLITTYQTNDFGADDPSYLDVNTPLTLGFLRWSARTRIAQEYPRHKLGDDSDRYGAGQALVTPNILRAFLVAWADQMHVLGLIENVDQFRADLIVERNLTDRNRVDVQMSPDLINQARIFGVKISFIL